MSDDIDTVLEWLLDPHESLPPERRDRMSVIVERLRDERDRLRTLAENYIEAQEKGELLPPSLIADVWRSALREFPKGDSGDG